MANEMHDDVLDAPLSYITTNTEKLHILSADPGLTWSNIAAYTLGHKTPPSFGAAGDRAGGGRKVTVTAITDGVVTGNGTASHYALTDDSLSKILATKALGSSQAVTSGNAFTLAAFDIGFPDPA